MAAHGPQVLESSPQEDDEETPEESDHGGGEESPPHPLAVAVTRHIWREGDDHVHLGYVDGGIRAEFIPAFGHFRDFLGHLPASTHGDLLRTGEDGGGGCGVGRRGVQIQALRGAPASAP